MYVVGRGPAERNGVVALVSRVHSSSVLLFSCGEAEIRFWRTPAFAQLYQVCIGSLICQLRFVNYNLHAQHKAVLESFIVFGVSH